MYEINLVPDIKAELLSKQKLRNLVILICIVAAIACAAVVLVFVGIVGTQAVRILGQDHEIECRAKGGKDCDRSYGTAVSNFSNVGTLLTMQNQMREIDVLEKNRINFSRIFPMFDVILPDGEDQLVKVSSITANFDEMTFLIEANSKTSQGYVPREKFVKGLKLTYYDYGSYMRFDRDTQTYVEIPWYCISEETIDGIQYGRYFKGKDGCEAPIIEEINTSDKDDLDERGNTKNKDDKKDDEDETDTATTGILIRRSYEDAEDLSSYREGNDRLAKDGEEKLKGYYFESACIVYGDDGKISESDTLLKCPLIESDDLVNIIEGSYGRNDDGKMVLTFTANFTVNREAFLNKNKHMTFVGPTRRNVTDSYLPVRDMFSDKEAVVEKEK